MEKEAPRAVVVVARRWFERTNGNTYHSVAVVVDGELEGVAPFTYGYGRQYAHTALEILEGSDRLASIELSRPLSYQLEERGILYFEDVVEVPRRKDLHFEGRA